MGEIAQHAILPHSFTSGVSSLVVAGCILPWFVLAGCYSSHHENDAADRSTPSVGAVLNHGEALHPNLDESHHLTNSTTASPSDFQIAEFRRIQLARLPGLAVCIGKERDVSVLLHLLLYCGFGETGLDYPATGQEALEILTHESLGIEYFGSSVIIPTRNVIRYNLPTSNAWTTGLLGESHRDQCLAVFAKLGLPLEYSIRGKSTNYQLRDLLSDSIANFTLDQAELSWTLFAYIHCLPPISRWSNKFGQSFAFDDVVEKLLSTSLRNTSCAGVHVLESLLLMERIDRIHKLLHEEVRRRLRAYLEALQNSAWENLNEDGSWDGSWYLPKRGSRYSDAWDSYSKLVVTGHLTELLFSSTENRKLLAKPALWLSNQLTLGSPDPRLSVCPLVHALRSVRLSLNERLVLCEMLSFFQNRLEEQKCVE